MGRRAHAWSSVSIRKVHRALWQCFASVKTTPFHRADPHRRTGASESSRQLSIWLAFRRIDRRSGDAPSYRSGFHTRRLRPVSSAQCLQRAHRRRLPKEPYKSAFCSPHRESSRRGPWSDWYRMDFARWARHRSNYRNCSTKAYHNRCTNHHRRCTKARSPKPEPARADAGYGSRVLRGCARAARLVAAAQSQAGSSAPVSRPAAAARSQPGSLEFGIRYGKGATAPPIKAPPRADVSTGAPPTAKMARTLDRNSNGHRPCSACAVNGPHPIPPHPPVPGSVAVFCGPDFSLIFTPREGCDEPQGLSDECGAFSVHCGLIATCVSEFSRCDRL